MLQEHLISGSRSSLFDDNGNDGSLEKVNANDTYASSDRRSEAKPGSVLPSPGRGIELRSRYGCCLPTDLNESVTGVR
jgi:hypothetical protein